MAEDQGTAATTFGGGRDGGRGPALMAEVAGEGTPLVVLHGLTATRRYVLMGSRLLQRGGRRVIAYDARGHGESDPAPERTAYRYPDLTADLCALLDEAQLERPALVGNSMGAATALAYALADPERVGALVLVTPPEARRPTEEDLAAWDALADGLERDGADGFLAVYDPPVEERYRDTVMRFTRQRLERHRHPRAVADALRAVPRSQPFDGLEVLSALRLPALVVGSRDAADPGHPLAAAEAYADALPRGELLVEDEGRSPLAWQGAQLSRAIAGFLARVDG